MVTKKTAIIERIIRYYSTDWRPPRVKDILRVFDCKPWYASLARRGMQGVGGFVWDETLRIKGKPVRVRIWKP